VAAGRKAPRPGVNHSQGPLDAIGLRQPSDSDDGM
jgi:hypothetical protein